MKACERRLRNENLVLSKVIHARNKKKEADASFFLLQQSISGARLLKNNILFKKTHGGQEPTAEETPELREAEAMSRMATSW